MIIQLHRNFEKQFKKLRPAERQKFKQKKDLFLENMFNPVLGNHPLSGRYSGYRSINITDDLRAVFKTEDYSLVTFTHIGTHHELYGS